MEWMVIPALGLQGTDWVVSPASIRDAKTVVLRSLVAPPVTRLQRCYSRPWLCDVLMYRLRRSSTWITL